VGWENEALAQRHEQEEPMIRPLGADDAEAFLALRREGLIEAPLAFASSPEDDFASDAESVRKHLRRAPDSVILGAFRPGLVGSVGVYRDRHRKSSHKAHLWGMYVTPAERGRGVGQALLEAALRHAGSLPGVSWVHL